MYDETSTKVGLKIGPYYGWLECTFVDPLNEYIGPPPNCVHC